MDKDAPGETKDKEGNALYDVFISYRRKDGADLARLIYDRLLKCGMKPFLDVEELRSGPFNTKLYSVIETCRNMILVLPKNGLNRCVNQDDWVRLEIEHALEHKINIVPIMMRGFEWPVKIPESLKELPNFNGLSASQEYFDAFIEKLILLLKDVEPIRVNSSVIDLRQVRSFASCGKEKYVFNIKKDRLGKLVNVFATFEPTRARAEVPEYAGVYCLFERVLDLTNNEKIVFSAWSEDESIQNITVEMKPEGKKWMHEAFDFQLSSEVQTYEILLADFSNQKTRACVEEITFVLTTDSFASEDKLKGSFCIANISIQ